MKFPMDSLSSHPSKGEIKMTNYFRITAYHSVQDLSIIMDSYGLFEKLWQFSADLVWKGFKILEVCNDERFLECNFEKVEEENDKFILRSSAKGKPETIGLFYNSSFFHIAHPLLLIKYCLTFTKETLL
jgi:hypothetical protein